MRGYAERDLHGEPTNLSLCWLMLNNNDDYHRDGNGRVLKAKFLEIDCWNGIVSLATFIYLHSVKARQI